MAKRTSKSSEGWLAASMGGLGIIVIAMLLVPVRDFIGHQNVAIILLLGVQVVAATGAESVG